MKYFKLSINPSVHPLIHPFIHSCATLYVILCCCMDLTIANENIVFSSAITQILIKVYVALATLKKHNMFRIKLQAMISDIAPFRFYSDCCFLQYRYNYMNGICILYIHIELLWLLIAILQRKKA